MNGCIWYTNYLLTIRENFNASNVQSAIPRINDRFRNISPVGVDLVKVTHSVDPDLNAKVTE
jgi:hypothetical protein